MTEKEFIQKVKSSCINATNIIGGYLPSVLIGQMCLQTGYGEGYNCEILMKWNNLLGMKTKLLNDTWTSNYWDGRSATKTTPQYYGYHTTIVDSFRVYNSIQQCACDYLQFMRDAKYSKNGNYKYRDVLNIKDPESLITQVSRRGYATDPQYITSVMKIIKKHNLTQYDNDIQKEIKKQMTLSEALSKLGVNLINIINENRGQVPAHNANSHEYFAVHYLGVNGQNPYLYGGGYGGHFYISKEGKCYQAAEVTDKLWHVGASSGYSYIHPYARNSNTIGVECATYTSSGRNNDDQTWYFTEKTQDTAAKLAAAVLVIYKLPLDHLLRHGDITTKNCPSPLKRDQGKGSNWTWDKFKSKTQQYINVLNNGNSISNFKTLKIGDSGEEVTNLQKNLQLLGLVDCVFYDERNFIDGSFGAITQQSVKYLQQIGNIQVDGIFGPKSNNVLNKHLKLIKDSEVNFTAKEFLANAKIVAQENKDNNYSYGNAPCLPSIYPKAKLTSCDRFVDQVLYKSGLKNIGNRRVSALAKYLSENKATKITNKQELKPGDIIFFNGHVFILGKKITQNLYERYDSGSDNRIKLINEYSNYSSQPFIENIDGFIYAYRLPFAQQERQYIKINDSGKDVKTLQTKLIKVGYYCGEDGADGSFGKNTLKALIAFQSDHKLNPDGIYGPLSRAKLEKIYTNVKEFENPKDMYSYSETQLETTDDLNLRNGSSTSHNILVTIPKGTKVKWYGYYTNSWYYIIYNDYVGYASKYYLK